jgi:chemotaxis protein CheD
MSGAMLPDKPVEINLMPGEYYFGDKNTRIHTILGSCIAMTLWHPQQRIGGMNHIVLPSRVKPGDSRLDGHYADEALLLFMHELVKSHTRPAEYQVKLFGGGKMFQRSLGGKAYDVAHGNIEAARALLDASGFNIQVEHVGGSGHRSIIFDLRDGSVLVKHVKI